MKMKVYLIFVFIIIIPFIFGGCSSNGGVGDDINDDKEIYSGRANLKLELEWNEFENLEGEVLKLSESNDSNSDFYYDDTLEITHTGARVEYVEDSAYFAQSVERKSDENKGLITFDLPATQKANIYTVAVHHEGRNSNKNIVYWLGKKENVKIPEDTVIEIFFDDIEWIKAEWVPYLIEFDPNQSIDINYENTEEIIFNDFRNDFLVPKEYNSFAIHFNVRDIFQINERTTYSDMLIGVWGSISWGDNIDSWRRFRSRYHREEEDSVTESGFQPYIDAQAFGFSGVNGYSIPPVMMDDYKIIWE